MAASVHALGQIAISGHCLQATRLVAHRIGQHGPALERPQLQCGLAAWREFGFEPRDDVVRVIQVAGRSPNGKDPHQNRNRLADTQDVAVVQFIR